MSFLDHFRKKNVELPNNEPNDVRTVGMDEVYSGQFYKYGQDWVDLAPPKITPSIKNCRKASHFPTVSGIINNLIMKTISSMVITSDTDNQDAINHILEMDKKWNLKSLMYECLWRNIVDGEIFYEKTFIDGHCGLRTLAFDGEKNLIKKVYDENSQLIGYKQLVVKKSALNDWKGMEFWETYQDYQVITKTFDSFEISNPILINIDGVGQSLVRNIIDIAYEINSLTSMMAKIVHKSANVMVATIGNSDRSEQDMNKETRDYVADQISNPHEKGVIVVPYGIELRLVGSDVLPKIEEYIKSLKSLLFEGLITPESLYSSESSNRSTAEVQLTDNSTGHVLFIEYCQEFIKSWLERDLINEELVNANYAEGDACISFMTGNSNLDNNYLEESSNEVDDDNSIPTGE